MSKGLHIRGDKYLWAYIALIGLFSFLPIYSASSNLAYLYGNGNTFRYLFKHALLLGSGFAILYFTHRINYRYIGGLSVIGLPVVVVLLVATLLQGKTVAGANASRWIQVPFVHLSFQTASLATWVVMAYTARYLSKIQGVPLRFREALVDFFVPVSLICGLILPAGFSTAALLFTMVLIMLFIGGFPARYTGLILAFATLGFILFVLTAKAFPDVLPSRVNTWISRVQRFCNRAAGDGYQSEKAKIAIASGGVFGVGPGKSAQKDFLPQSSSDFIFAVIVEEYGWVGGTLILLLFILFFIRIMVISTKMPSLFGILLVIGMALPIAFQAFVNMGVAVGLLPVTGQTMPFISSGGTALWMSCLEVGIILSASRVLTEGKREDRLESAESGFARTIAQHID